MDMETEKMCCLVDKGKLLDRTLPELKEEKD